MMRLQNFNLIYYLFCYQSYSSYYNDLDLIYHLFCYLSYDIYHNIQLCKQVVTNIINNMQIHKQIIVKKT